MQSQFDGEGFFWIIGLRRSGTSILRRLLAASPNIGPVLFEPHPLFHAIGMNHLDRFKAQGYVQKILQDYTAQKRPGKWIGAKLAINPGAGGLEWIWLPLTFKGSKIVFVTRGIRETWRSYEAADRDIVRGFVPWTAYQPAAEFTVARFRQHIKEHPADAIEVKYENILADVDEALRPVFEFLKAAVPTSLARMIERPKFLPGEAQTAGRKESDGQKK